MTIYARRLRLRLWRGHTHTRHPVYIGDRGRFLSDLGGFSILVLRVYYDVYYSRLIHYMYYERIRVYYRYRNVIHCISMYYGVLDLEILIPYNTPLCRRDTCITRRCPATR